ncbi:MAG: 2-hydroxyglutaryl-CoA dehydratase [Proteobacteria bacterium]|nr:2-hydroxyglutaryl-CoA dehydratase [Pseudomonadota bacterium]MCP4919393.1 2-hydroxyglutaryl-CoA dehydratase [Pseudomonadota bacterium]
MSRITAGVDLGSTYCKVVLQDDDGKILARAMNPTGFRLTEIARATYETCLSDAGLDETDVSYVVATGVGRHQVDFKDIAVTELTAAARGATYFFPETRSVLDIGGQTMKASRLDDSSKVLAFRLNDKCAAGTGAFLEKTARYMGYTVQEISAVMETSRNAVPISGVCAVFAESEVINHLSLGTPPGDIMQGAIESLTTRTVQLMKRVKAQPEYTLVGGILRFGSMARTVEKSLGHPVNVPPEDYCQYVSALGGAILGHMRLEKMSTVKPVTEARV